MIHVQPIPQMTDDCVNVFDGTLEARKRNLSLARIA